MSILVALAAAAGVVGTLLWRLGAASSAVRETAEAVSSLHGLVRRWNWQRLATRSPLADVTDPKEAAAAMLVAVAETDGALTEAETAMIRGEMSYRFLIGADEAATLLARGRWLASKSGNLDETLRKLRPAIEQALDADERRELIAMLRQAAGAAAAPDSLTGHAIRQLELRLVDRR